MLETSPSSLRFLRVTLSVVIAFCATVSSACAQSSLFQDDETSWVSLLEVAHPRQPENVTESPSNFQRSRHLPDSSQSSARNFRPKDSVTLAPAIMGGFYGGGIPYSNFVASGVLPIGSGRSKIADNGKALPMDRVFLGYNHYVNAFSYSTGVAVSSVDVDEYTLGAEKTFLDGLWSAELRMPFTSDESIGSEFQSIKGGNVGNLTLNLKSSLYRSSDTSIVAGLGMTFPTGSDANFVDKSDTGNGFSVRNEAVHLMPFVGFLKTPTDRFFYQAFVQADIAANGNTVTGFQRSNGFDKLYEANLFYFDLQGGYWFYQDRTRKYFPGAAALVELHDRASLRASDTVYAAPSFGGPVTGDVGLQLDVTQMTALRIGGVFPITQDHDVFFDGELLIQLNCYF